MGSRIDEAKKENKVAIIIFVLSLSMTIGLGVIVLQGIVQEAWYIDLVIYALGATAFTSLFEALRR